MKNFEVRAFYFNQMWKGFSGHCLRAFTEIYSSGLSEISYKERTECSWCTDCVSVETSSLETTLTTFFETLTHRDLATYQFFRAECFHINTLA